MSYDHRAIEAECLDLWERTGIYRFDATDDGPLFAVDTPPPYVSAAHLHVGHAMSYTQAEFVVRWQRMRGKRVFYPMGFDDNGLPTERYVERAYGIDRARSPVSRSAFRALCLEETRAGAARYEALWRSLGLSVDWSLRYSTIDEHCQRTAQRSFIELFEAGRIYRSDEPVLWDPEMQTSLAQADLEVLTRRQKLHTVRFGASKDLAVATTRPELLPACVALYHHPDDARYAGLTEARHPLADRSVPVRTDEDVVPDFGTGLMMVCTFGDADDVRRWKRDGLELRPCIGPDGRLLPLAGDYAGLSTTEARARILRDLQAADRYDGFEMTEQAVPIAERSGVAVEWQMAPQWFVRLWDLKRTLRACSDQVRWYPPHMKARLDHWIEGLKWDWNISRSRFYGVPMPVWLCIECSHAVPARREDLPVDPLEDPPPLAACPRCGGALEGDPDVMDTWMTSSLTPLINANWAGSPGRTAGPHPMTLRVQAHEIIRTWLFYTLLKSHLHEGVLPWRDVMISGWGLNEQGKKISKRDLAQSGESASGASFNRYDPRQVIERWGADALRHWAGRAALGQNLRYHARDVKAGRRVAVKLWNAGVLAQTVLDGQDPAVSRPTVDARPPEDRDVLHALDELASVVGAALEAYDYATALSAIDRCFFGRFCDDWLEGMKDRVYKPERFPEGSARAAKATLYEGLRQILGLYAPFLPFVTEAVWQRLFAAVEDAPSLHVTAFPTASGYPAVPEMDLVRDVRKTVRTLRTAQRLPQGRELDTMVLAVEQDALREALTALEPTLRATCRAREVRIGATAAGGATPVEGRPGLTVTLPFPHPPLPPHG